MIRWPEFKFPPVNLYVMGSTYMNLDNFDLLLELEEQIKQDQEAEELQKQQDNKEQKEEEDD